MDRSVEAAVVPQTEISCAPNELQPSAKSFRQTTLTAHPIVYRSAELLQGHREAWIEHGDQMYRLRVTSAGKLYLTK